MTKSAPLSKVDELRNAVNKAVGEDVLYKGSDPKYSVSYIPTGLLPFDLLLQGGIPRGRFTMLQGDWSTLKSYVGLNVCRETQALGGVAAIIDTEHAYDPSWAKEQGIDTDLLIVEQPESGELAIDTAEALTRAGVDFILFDSVAATLPQQERNTRLHKENVQPGRQAALFSMACRRLTTANSNTAYLWINQFRENIGITFGPREKASGGRALPYYMSYIVDIKKIGKITHDHQIFDGEKFVNSKLQVGQKFKAELVKSKLNKPFREMLFNWSLTDGEIDLGGYLFNQGMELGIITKSGNSYTYDGKKAVGRDNFKTKVLGDPQIVDLLHDEVLVAYGAKAPAKRPKRAKSVNTRSSTAQKKTLRKR